jgi:hypothetical protein
MSDCPDCKRYLRLLENAAKFATQDRAAYDKLWHEKRHLELLLQEHKILCSHEFPCEEHQTLGCRCDDCRWCPVCGVNNRE